MQGIWPSAVIVMEINVVSYQSSYTPVFYACKYILLHDQLYIQPSTNKKDVNCIHYFICNHSWFQMHFNVILRENMYISFLYHIIVICQTHGEKRGFASQHGIFNNSLSSRFHPFLKKFREFNLSLHR